MTPDEIINKYKELIDIGEKLLPLGGFDFSGYNARLQSKYTNWRKDALETFEQTGPIGFPYKQKILSTPNNEYFYQSSVYVILNCLRELHEKIKSSPQLIETPGQEITDLPPLNSTVQQETGESGVRVLKPPPKRAIPQSGKSETASVSVAQPAEWSNKVYVIGEPDDILYAQLLQFLHEIGIEEIPLEREHGKAIVLDSFDFDKSARYAFFIINEDDLSYAMFEIGHFVGRLGKDRVCVLHMSDVNFPKNVPGVLVKPIVIKLEEASLAILKELKMAGYKIDL